jgi:membrane associated rhomboid family serine protease
MISSETAFIWREIKLLLMLPLTFIQVVLRRQRPAALLEPISYFVSFIIQPRGTALLMGTMVAVYAYQLFAMPVGTFDSLVFRPGHITSLDAVPVITSWFLHGSLAHLGGNLLFLFVFGRIVEARLGTAKMLIVFFGSGIVSSVISGLAGQGGIGASGAIAGVIATAVLLSPFSFTFFFFGLPVPIFIVGWLALLSDVTGVLFPQDNNIGHIAHLGGYAAVSVLVFLLPWSDRRTMLKGLMVNLLIVAAIVLYLGLGPKLI